MKSFIFKKFTKLNLNKLQINFFSQNTNRNKDKEKDNINAHISQSQHFNEKLILVDEYDKAISSITKLDGK